MEALVEQRAAALANEAKAFYQLAAEQHKAAAAEPAPTDLEKLAARLVVERVGGAPGGGPGGGGAAAGGPGAGQQAQQRGTPEDRAAAQAALARIPVHVRSELNILLGQKKTALEIRDFLSGEFEPIPLEHLMAHLRAQEKLGALKLTEKPEEPLKPAPAKRPPKRRN
jgi:hypothetical protein